MKCYSIVNPSVILRLLTVYLIYSSDLYFTSRSKNDDTFPTKYILFLLCQKETLQEFGIVFWAEPATRFRTAELFSIERQAEKTGLVAWPLTHPTSTLTHYNMFRYFNTTHRDYHFHRMVEPHRLLLYNTPEVHQKLMLPWVQCALDLDCIAPVGSQPHGCDYSHRPRYIYAGCHKYDMSAFNVVLGQVFRGETPYIAVMDLFTVASPAPAPKRNWMGTWNLTAAFKLGS